MNYGKAIAGIGLAVALAVSGVGSNAIAQLNPGARPNFGTVVLRPGFLPDPHTVSVVSGGGMQAQAIAGPNCRGWITPQPDVRLVLQGTSGFMRIYAQSQSDTTLVVRRPDGQILCNDDTYGLNPSVEGTMPGGVYNIWVGSYRQGENARATVGITEISSVHP